MAYRLSDRRQQDKTPSSSKNELDFSKVANVFIVFGLISFATAWFFGLDGKEVLREEFRLSNAIRAKEIGPIGTKEHNEVYRIYVNAEVLSLNSSYISGKVLDQNKKHLFTFGQKIFPNSSGYSRSASSNGLSTSVGRSNNNWAKSSAGYSIDVTFNKPGTYYILVGASKGPLPEKIALRIAKKSGSSVPHTIFGILLIIAGVILYYYEDQKKRILSNGNNDCYKFDERHK